MGRPYTMDLRERVVASVVSGGLSRREAAARFDVRISTVIAWVKQFLETGSLAPGQMSGHKLRAIRGEHEVWLLGRIDRGSFTLRGLVAELGECGLKTNYRAVWHFMHAQKRSFKKKRWRLASRTVRTSREGVGNGPSIRAGLMRGPWSFSTRPGPRPIWRPCEASHSGEAGSKRRSRMATGRP